MTNPQKEEALKELGDNPTWVSSCHTANVYVGCLLIVTGAQLTMTVVPFQMALLIGETVLLNTLPE